MIGSLQSGLQIIISAPAVTGQRRSRIRRRLRVRFMGCPFSI